VLKRIYQTARYWIDNSFSRRGSLAGWTILLFSLAIITGVGFAEVVKQATPVDIELDQTPTFISAFWTGVQTVLGLSATPTVLTAIVQLWFWFVGIMILGTIFAWRTSALDQLRQRMLAGRAPIRVTGHFLILGWSPLVFSLIREIARSTESRRKSVVVILSETARQEIERDVSEYLERLELGGILRVIVRTGNPVATVDLERVNVTAARSIAVVEPDGSSHVHRVPAVVVAAVRQGLPEDTRIVAESKSPDVTRLLSAVDADVLPIETANAVAQVAAQSACHPVIVRGLLDLMDFAGTELHVVSAGSLSGLSFGEAQYRIQGGSLVGLSSSEGITFAPDAATLIGVDDRAVIAAESGLEAEAVSVGPSQSDEDQTHIDWLSEGMPARTVCVLGNSQKMVNTAAALQRFLPAGSTVIAICETDDFSKQLATIPEVRTTQVSQLLSSESTDAIPPECAEVIVLGSGTISEEVNTQDSLTALLVQMVRKQLAKRNLTPRMTIEIANPINRHLPGGLEADEVLIGDEIAAMLMAQALRDFHIANALIDLGNPTRGATLQALPISLPKSGDIMYRDVVAAGAAKGLAVLGWGFELDNVFHVQLGEPGDTGLSGASWAVALGIRN